MKPTLMPCPICGAKAFIKHDVVDGFNFGWEVGCPAAKIGDEVHGLKDYEAFKAARLNFMFMHSRMQAARVWNDRCKEAQNDKF